MKVFLPASCFPQFPSPISYPAPQFMTQDLTPINDPKWVRRGQETSHPPPYLMRVALACHNVRPDPLDPFMFYLRIRFSNPPTARADIIIIKADFNISFIPNSLIRVTKVATQGKYIVKTTDATTS